MRITDVKTYVVEVPPPARGGRNWIFVKLTTDNGISGVGEPVRIGFDPLVTAKMIQSMADRHVINMDPFNVEQLFRKIYMGVYRPGAAHMGVISGFEMACWDIIGKAVGQPIYNLLGGKYHDKIRSYTYLYPAPDDKTHAMFDIHAIPDIAAQRALDYMNMGFTAVKIDPALPIMVPAPGQLSEETLQNTELVIKRVREAVGDKCDIILGMHGQMTTSSAIRLANRLEKFDPLWFEEPIPPENKDEMARVAHHTTIPVATGERLYTKYEFRELLVSQAAQVLQFTLGSVGGFMEAKKVAGMAEAYYAQIAPHLHAGPITTMANVQLDVCSPNFLIQESIENFVGFYHEIVKNPIVWDHGYIIPPTGPGLGIELNEEAVQKHLLKGS